MLSFGLLILAACALPFTDSFYTTTPNVHELTQQTFKGKVLDSDDIWMVEFYAPWCGHCKNLAPEWIKAADATKGIVKFGAVNMDDHASVGQPYGIKGFPTIKVFKGGKPTDYNGARTAQGLADHAVTMVQHLVKERLGGGKSSGSSGGGSGEKGSGTGGSDVVELTDANFESKVLKSNDLWLVEFFAPWCGHCKRLEPEWKSAAKDLKGKVKLGALDATVHTVMASRYGVQGYPTIKAFLGNKDQPVDYDGGRDAASIVTWANDKAAVNLPAPEVNQLLNEDVLKAACLEHQLCVVAILPHILDSMATGRNAYLATLRELGDKYKARQWGWVWAEAGSQPGLETALGIGGFGYPAMATVNARKMKYALLKGSFSEEGINDFLRTLAAGRGRTEPVKGDALPTIDVIEPWDGKDGQLPVDEDIDLSDIELDAKIEL